MTRLTFTEAEQQALHRVRSLWCVGTSLISLFSLRNGP